MLKESIEGGFINNSSVEEVAMKYLMKYIELHWNTSQEF
jgi:hypothetical protein